MSSSRLVLPIALLGLLLSGVSAQAAATHVLRAQAFGPQPEARTIALASGSAGMTDAARALTEGLSAAGFRVVTLQEHPALIATVSYEMRPLCTEACRSLTGHDDAPLSDYYTRRALVVAHRAEASSTAGDRPVAWYAALTSDGLSNRERDYLPSMLRAGAKAYGRTVDAGDR